VGIVDQGVKQVKAGREQRVGSKERSLSLAGRAEARPLQGDVAKVRLGPAEVV
jgi:hypothetical protein